MIAQQSPGQADGDTLTFLYDGHGSTRALRTPAAAVAVNTVGGTWDQRFAYDGYGNILVGTGLTAAAANAMTTLLYSGEQTDRTGLQYLRARYYDPSNGRFNRLDPFAGDLHSPLSLHKYLYAGANPISNIDPTGQFFSVLEFLITNSGGQSLEKLQSAYKGGKGTAETAKFLVRFALVQMELLVHQMPSFNGKNYLSFYYLQEWLMFEKRFKGNKALKLAPRIAELTSYVATLPGAAARIKSVGMKPSPLTSGFLSSAAKGEVQYVTLVLSSPHF